jgi:glutathione S-transferase
LPTAPNGYVLSGPKSPLPKLSMTAAEHFRLRHACLENHMKERPFIVGDSVTVADFVMAYTLDWANEAKLLDGFPQLQAYMQRMYARPHSAPRIAEAFRSIM